MILAPRRRRTMSGPNPAATEALPDWTTSAEAADLVAASGFLSPNRKVDPTLYGPVSSIAAQAAAATRPQFVLGDLLPGDLVDEYRVELQRFVQDPPKYSLLPTAWVSLRLAGLAAFGTTLLTAGTDTFDAEITLTGKNDSSDVTFNDIVSVTAASIPVF